MNPMAFVIALLHAALGAVAFFGVTQKALGAYLFIAALLTAIDGHGYLTRRS